MGQQVARRIGQSRLHCAQVREHRTVDHAVVAAHEDRAGIAARRTVGRVAHLQDRELLAGRRVLRPEITQPRARKPSADHRGVDAFWQPRHLPPGPRGKFAIGLPFASQNDVGWTGFAKVMSCSAAGITPNSF